MTDNILCDECERPLMYRGLVGGMETYHSCRDCRPDERGFVLPVEYEFPFPVEPRRHAVYTQ